MSKKVLLITLIVLLVVLGVAGVLYPKLSSGMQTQQLATTPPATTEVADATEATQPETIPAPPESYSLPRMWPQVLLVGRYFPRSSR